ncbi:hypothetical protein DKG71_00535 [Streptomyces sp. NEAU-S7GS2]|nr:hypothetical protein DKG71_00535 [Streptomyces sp. NEAU-S7GS2]
MTGLSVFTIQKAKHDKALTLPTLLAIADALETDTSVILGQQAPCRAMDRADRSDAGDVEQHACPIGRERGRPGSPTMPQTPPAGPQ